MKSTAAFFRRLLGASASRYTITGVTAWLIDNGLFSILKWIFGNKRISVPPLSFSTLTLFTVIGMVSGFVFSFLTNRKWTFHSNSKMRWQLFRCIVLLAFNTLVTAVAVNLAGLTHIYFLPDIVKYTMSCAIGVWNYFIYKRWVYK